VITRYFPSSIKPLQTSQFLKESSKHFKVGMKALVLVRSSIQEQVFLCLQARSVSWSPYCVENSTSLISFSSRFPWLNSAHVIRHILKYLAHFNFVFCHQAPLRRSATDLDIEDDGRELAK